MTTQLGDLDGEAFTHTTIKLTNAGDGLSQALRVEPVWLRNGDEGYCIVKFHVGSVTGKPRVGKNDDLGGLERIVTLVADGAAMADEDLVGPTLRQMADRLRELRDAESGQGSILSAVPDEPEEDDDEQS